MTILKNTPEVKTSLLEEFDTNGYIVVKNAIDPSKLQTLRDSFSEMLSDSNSDKVFRPGNKDFVHDVIPNLPKVKGILFDALVDNPSLLDLITNEKVLPALKTLLGNDFVLLPDFVVQWNYFNILHTDMTTAEQRGATFHLEDDYRIVSVGIYLQDNTLDGGGLYLVPGSHKQHDPCIKFRQEFSNRKKKTDKSLLKRIIDNVFKKQLEQCRNQLIHHPEGIDVPSKMGDVVIFDNRILHRSTFPEDMTKLSAGGGKMAFMGSCSVNNQHARHYIDMLNAKATNNYQSRERNLEPLNTLAEAVGIKAT